MRVQLSDEIERYVADKVAVRTSLRLLWPGYTNDEWCHAVARSRAMARRTECRQQVRLVQDANGKWRPKVIGTGVLVPHNGGWGLMLQGGA